MRRRTRFHFHPGSNNLNNIYVHVITMIEKLWTVAVQFGIALKKHAGVIVLGIVSIATSDTTKNLTTSIGRGFLSVGSRAVRNLLSLAGKAFPRARDLIVIGLIQGFKVFRAQFNHNGANAVRSTRNKLSPLDKLSVIASLTVAVFAPVLGVAMIIGTYVVFYKDADNLPLTVLGTDAGIDSVLGVGTALIVNAFKMVGAFGATVNWIIARLDWWK